MWFKRSLCKCKIIAISLLHDIHTKFVKKQIGRNNLKFQTITHPPHLIKINNHSISISSVAFPPLRHEILNILQNLHNFLHWNHKVLLIVSFFFFFYYNWHFFIIHWSCQIWLFFYILITHLYKLKKNVDKIQTYLDQFGPFSLLILTHFDQFGLILTYFIGLSYLPLFGL